MLNEDKRVEYFREFNPLIDELSNPPEDKFPQYFSEVVNYFIHISVPKIFSEHRNHFAELEKELVSDFDILLSITEQPLREKYETVIKPAILKRKEETLNFFILKN